MKTAEQWCKDEKTRLIPMHVPDIQQIQLDAMREGMRRAAETVHPKGKPCPNSITYINTIASAKDNILSAAESLTEKDL